MIDNNFHFHWITDNKKLASIGAIGFAIPALTSEDGFQTCPGAGACAALCFARRGWYTSPQVEPLLEHNLQVLRTTPSEVLVDKLVEDITRRSSYRVVRWHVAGDLYSQAYLDLIYEVARRLPDRRHYAYTKCLHLDLWTNKPENFVIVQSEGGRYDHLIDPAKPTARIFPSVEALVRAGYSNAQHSDLPAASGDPRIGLVFHGGVLTDTVRKLLDCVSPVPPPSAEPLATEPTAEDPADEDDQRVA